MKIKGFTLIELLIVITIIGILAALSIPNMLVALQKSRQKATMSDMRSIGVAVDSYITDLHYAPQTTEGDISVLAGESFFVPFYIKKMPANDGWGNPLQWERESGLDGYSINSWGRDGVRGGPFGNPVINTFYVMKTLTDFNNDIVFSNGIFTFGPVVKN
jgi:general secretion pathway protein G